MPNMEMHEVHTTRCCLTTPWKFTTITRNVVKYGEKDGFLYNNCDLSNLPAPSNMSPLEGWEGL